MDIGGSLPEHKAAAFNSITEIRNLWSFTSTLPIYLHGTVLAYRDNFTFDFTNHTVNNNDM
jgi:hypothetical protein